MAERESTDAAGTEADTDKRSSTDPWPKIDRDTDGTATGDEPAAADQTSDDDEIGTATQGDENTRKSDDHSHGCDPDNDVPCRFQ